MLQNCKTFTNINTAKNFPGHFLSLLVSRYVVISSETGIVF